MDNPRIRQQRGVDVRFAADMLAGIESTTKSLRQQQEAIVRAQRKRPASRRAVVTATVHGSFGFRIEEESDPDAEEGAVPLASGVVELGGLLERLGGGEEEFEAFLAETPAPVRSELGKLFKTVADRDAALKFSGGGHAVAISVEQVRATAGRLDTDVRVETIKVHGVLLAVLTKRPKRFEASVHGASETERVSGMIDPTLSSDDLQRMQEKLTGQPGFLAIRRTVWKYQHRERVILALSGFTPDNPELLPIPASSN